MILNQVTAVDFSETVTLEYREGKNSPVCAFQGAKQEENSRRGEQYDRENVGMECARRSVGRETDGGLSYSIHQY